MGRWIEEEGVFVQDFERLTRVLQGAGHTVEVWPAHLSEARLARLDLSTPTFFHGSLEWAATLATEAPSSLWPGALCDVARFHCHAWYEALSPLLVHQKWAYTTVEAFVSAPDAVLAAIGETSHCFVRPDSPLKPFSGRVLTREQISLAALDHGFYYEALDLPIVVAPCRQIGRERRAVVVDGEVVASSGYLAEGRVMQEDDATRDLALRVVRRALALLGEAAPQRAYVCDVAEVEGSWRVMELNPLSGADLYGCDRRAIAEALFVMAR